MQQLNEIAIRDKWRLETGKGKTNLPQDVYTQICELDPTTKNGNAGKYCDWLLKRVTPDMLRDTDKVRRLRIALEQFNDGKKRGILQRYGIPMDIGQYKTADELINTISGIMSQGTAVSQSTANKMEQLKGQYDIVGEGKDWIVVHPKTFEAERYFGSGTEWCTVGNEEYFRRYSKQGPLYITFPKNGDDKLKMQFHFESKSFANYQDKVYDNPKVCIANVLQEDKNRIEPLFELWSRINPDFNDYQYTFFDEAQGLLDSGKRPEEVFDWIDDFNNDFATVILNGKWNFIDKEGKILSDQWFDYVGGFINGFAAVKLNGKYNFISIEGKLLFPNQWYDRIFSFHDGFAPVKLNGKWNFINTEGKILSQQWFEDTGIFHNGYAKVWLNGKWIYIDTKGNLYDYDPRQQQSNVLTESKRRNFYLTEQQVEVIKRRLESVRADVNTEPTEGQKKAGNYKMAHITIQGFEITIENPKGSYRKGRDRGGKQWKCLMKNDYGYFRHTLGKDGDAIDVFIGPHLESEKIYCVDQNIDGKFDETKVMLGFNTEDEAKTAYLANYSKDWKGFGHITEVDREKFKKWLYDGYRQRKPFYKYADVKRFYITEAQLNYIQKRLNEEEFSQENMVARHAKNEVIKLYHSTTVINLDEIIMDGELRTDTKHPQGHGDMIFFSTKPENYQKEATLSIEVPASEFGFGNDDFKFLNNVEVAAYHNVSLDKYNFKIENVKGLRYDRIMELLEEQGSKILDKLNFPDFIMYWFADRFYEQQARNENTQTLNESSDTIEDMFENEFEITAEIIDEFVQNPNGTMNWAPLINPYSYQKALNEFVSTGTLERFPSDKIYQWIGVIMRNFVKLTITTRLGGHDTSFDMEDIINSSLPTYIAQKYGLVSIDDYSDGYLLFNINADRLVVLVKDIAENYYGIKKGLFNESAIHRSGPWKGQTVEFYTQDEVDDMDNKQKTKMNMPDEATLTKIDDFLQDKRIGQITAINGNVVTLKLGLMFLLGYIGFYDWLVLPDGTDAVSDYGLKPLYNVLKEYTDSSTPEQTLVIINKALDVTHQRGDLSSIFIQGGRSTLTKISSGGFLS